MAVHATCRTCNDVVELGGGDIWVIIQPDYTCARIVWACPRCEHIDEKATSDPRLVDLLIRQGAIVG